MVLDITPDGMPVLSRGKHRTPRRGACFMEMASVLAGEPWTDSPRCTHPLLAHLARTVNDATSDAARGLLAPHIPSVIGVRGGGLSWEVTLTAAVAMDAVPWVPERFQRVLAVGLLRCEQVALTLRPEEVDGLEAIRGAMADVPHATAWARRFASGMPVTTKEFPTRSAPRVMSCAVQGITEAAAPDTDERLRHLLTTAIDTARRLRPPEPDVVGADVVDRDGRRQRLTVPDGADRAV